MLGGLEMHQVDSTSFTPKRYLFMKQPRLLKMDDLDAYFTQNGYEKKGYLFESRNMVAFLYKDGIAFASRSCRKNLGETREM